jgi:hypothetical protein
MQDVPKEKSNGGKSISWLSTLAAGGGMIIAAACQKLLRQIMVPWLKLTYSGLRFAFLLDSVPAQASRTSRSSLERTWSNTGCWHFGRRFRRRRSLQAHKK